MKITLLSVGKTRSKECATLEDEYAKRIRGRFEFVRQYVKNDKELIAAAEQAKGVILLDEHGKQLDSHDFSSYIESKGQQFGELTFVMGDAAGIPEELKGAVQERIGLSELTFPHEIARVMFCEQLYRAQTIIEGHPYHK